jgi:hypothetical protein
VGALNPARLLAFAAVVFVFPSVAVGASRGSHPSAAQRAAIAAARATLLRHSDLHGWSSSPGPKKAPALTCGAFEPNVAGVKPLGAAASPTFAQSSSGPFVSGTAYVYGSSAKERTFWHRVVTRRLETCVADGLEAGSTSSVTFDVNHKSLMSLPRIGARDAGYRVSGSAVSTDGSQTVYLDMLVVANGSAIGAISFTNFFDPVPRSFELRMARLVAKRLGSAG